MTVRTKFSLFSHVFTLKHCGVGSDGSNAHVGLHEWLWECRTGVMFWIGCSQLEQWTICTNVIELPLFDGAWGHAHSTSQHSNTLTKIDMCIMCISGRWNPETCQKSVMPFGVAPWWAKMGNQPLWQLPTVLRKRRHARLAGTNEHENTWDNYRIQNNTRMTWINSIDLNHIHLQVQAMHDSRVFCQTLSEIHCKHLEFEMYHGT